MDVRFIAWAGYQFAETGSSISVGACPPSITSYSTGSLDLEGIGIGNLHISSNDLGELNLSGEDLENKVQVSTKDIKPKLVAFPEPGT